MNDILRKGSFNPNLLRPRKKAHVPGMRNFVVAQDVLANANIGQYCTSFIEFFMGFVSDEVQKAGIVGHQLEDDAEDSLIMDILGDKTEIHPFHLLVLVGNQSDGREGVLLNRQRENIAYMKDKNRIRRTVFVMWISERRFWAICARPTSSDHKWAAGYQVLSLA